MNVNFDSFLIECNYLNKPIAKVSIQEDSDAKNTFSVYIVANWISEKKTSESLDFLINIMTLTIEKEIISRITYFYLYDSLENYSKNKNVGFRVFGVFH